MIKIYTSASGSKSIENSKIYIDPQTKKVTAKVILHLDIQSVDFYASSLPRKDGETREWDELLVKMDEFTQ
jgi:hypothetical protein